METFPVVCKALDFHGRVEGAMGGAIALMLWQLFAG